MGCCLAASRHASCRPADQMGTWAPLVELPTDATIGPPMRALMGGLNAEVGSRALPAVCDRVVRDIVVSIGSADSVWRSAMGDPAHCG